MAFVLFAWWAVSDDTLLYLQVVLWSVRVAEVEVAIPSSSDDVSRTSLVFLTDRRPSRPVCCPCFLAGCHLPQAEWQGMGLAGIIKHRHSPICLRPSNNTYHRTFALWSD